MAPVIMTSRGTANGEIPLVKNWRHLRRKSIVARTKVEKCLFRSAPSNEAHLSTSHCSPRLCTTFLSHLSNIFDACEIIMNRGPQRLVCLMHDCSIYKPPPGNSSVSQDLTPNSLRSWPQPSRPQTSTCSHSLNTLYTHPAFPVSA